MASMDTKPLPQAFEELILSLEKELEALEGEEKKLLEELILEFKRSKKKKASEEAV